MPTGPIERVVRGGLAHHYDVTKSPVRDLRHAGLCARAHAPSSPRAGETKIMEAARTACTTVLDFSTLLPGPMATLMLAEAGAEVVRGQGNALGSGEGMRSYTPQWGPYSASISHCSIGGKKGLSAIDLKDKAQLAKA